jgi:hypothetical protein
MLSENDIIELSENIEVKKIQHFENNVFESDLEFKSAIKESLNDQEVILYESDFIKRAISINPYLILFGILAFVASFAFSIGPVMWVLFSELFPNYIRGLAISFIGFINSLISFIVQLVFPWELANFGNSATFLIYGIFGAIGLLFILIFLPETKGKSLEELEKILVKSK